MGRSGTHPRRGEAFGIKKDDPRRAIFSSPFNFIPLDRDVHKGPYRDHTLVRRLFLEIAKEKVMSAVRDGRYQMDAPGRRLLGFG